MTDFYASLGGAGRAFKICQVEDRAAALALLAALGFEEDRHGICVMAWTDKCEWLLETSGARFKSPRLIEFAP